MDTFGNYPGSTVKDLTVEEDALVRGDLTVDGDLTVNGSIIGPAITPDRVYTEDGTESLPAYSYQDEKDTGFYRSAPGEVSFSGRGTKRLRIGETSSTSTGTWAATKFYSDDGAATAPAVSFTSDTTSGWYKSNPGETTFSAAGTPGFVIGPSASLCLNQFTSLKNLTTDGTAATPSTTYVTEPNTGWYRSAPGEISYSGRGTRRFRIAETGAETTGDFTAAGASYASTFIPSSFQALLTSVVASSCDISSANSPWHMKVGGTVAAVFTDLGAQFPAGATALTFTATSSSLGSATATSLNVQTLTSTTSTLGTASASSLSATTLTATTSTLGTATASSLTASTMTATTSTVTTLTATTGNITTLNATTSSLGDMLGTSLVLSGQSYIELENTSSMTITTSTDTLVTFTNIFRQVGTGITLDGGDNGSIVIASSTNGFYVCTAVCQWAYAATGTRESFLLRNSSYRVAWSALPAPSVTTNLTVSITASTYMLTSGSTMQFRVWQTSGGDLNLTGIRLYMGRVW